MMTFTERVSPSDDDNNNYSVDTSTLESLISLFSANKMSTRTVDIPQDVIAALKKFRFTNRKSTAAISVKIVKASLSMAVDEEFEDQSIEEIAEELPENHPRYVLLSHELKHKDGRISYPLLLINWRVCSYTAPSGAPMELMTLHASSLNYFQQVAEVAKVLEVRDGAEGLDTKAVDDKLLAN
uniref:ADF-H domain-containing protein n=1 Tax=Kwoniella bestiolae CBS 10118 TaxID=1296100 RepID=A0A1B9G965_9TREE|nr:hypothetical protein I302_02373 [Kwoniella bestiolae CBS 10118]OCF27531.1 hypothetical protein I302_02373 [Kwoniella bestiolae CBS 10118]